ncbi:hypothetical protein AB6O49_18870 [Streptomyces sp. SBR177]
MRRDDEGAQRHVAGLAQLEDDLLRVAVPGLAQAALDRGGGVARAADDDGAAGGDDDRAVALGRLELHGAGGARQGDGLDRLRGPAVVEHGGGDDRGTLRARLGLGDHEGVLDLDVVDRDGGVVRTDLERLRVVARTTGGQGGDRDHDGGGGEGAASKAAAHGGGNSLDERTDWENG